MKTCVTILLVVFLILAGMFFLRQCTRVDPAPEPTAIITEVVLTPTEIITPDPTQTPAPVIPTATVLPDPTKTKIPTSTPVPPIKTVYAIDVYNYGGQVWFRRGPSQNFPPRDLNAVLNDGDEIEILGCYNPAGTFADWVKVSSNRIAGYVFGQFVEPYPCE